MRCIVDGDSVTFPQRGERVHIKWTLNLAPLAGMQLKFGASGPAEGVLFNVTGVADSNGHVKHIEFELTLDSGELKKILVPFNPMALSAVFVVSG